MFILTQLNINQRQRLWALMDTHTRQPLLYPLLYLIDHLALRSSATQSASLQALKFFYEFWHQKHGVTFCFSFYSSNHNPFIAIDELTAFFHYLENTHFYVPALTIRSTTQTMPQRRTNIRHVHSVIRFIRYLINTYISPNLYSATSEFNIAMENVQLIEVSQKTSRQLSSATSHEHSDVNIQIRSLIEKYSSELEKVSGAKEIYEELIIAVPSRESEFRKLSLEQDKRHIKINEKINTLIGIVNKNIAISQ